MTEADGLSRMRRDLAALSTTSFDVLVVGGGIHGICTAWDAALRGLSVALIEAKDFGWATSANSLKIVHGGLRYLQHGDIRRVRESATEQATLLRIAPHLVQPLPVLIPTWGHGLRGREVLALALTAYESITRDRHRPAGRERRLPRWRLLSQKQVTERLPGLSTRGLTGGALFYEAQIVDSERLVLAFVRSTSEAGGCVANYVRARRCLQEQGRVVGVEATDELAGDSFPIKARVVIDATGPWVGDLEGRTPGGVAKAFNVLSRRPLGDYALGVPAEDHHDPDAVIDRGARLLFATPWRGRSLIGTAYVPHDEHPDQLAVACTEVQEFVDMVNRALPWAGLEMDDITLVHRGLLPRADTSAPASQVQLMKHPIIRDHAKDGRPGLFSVTGVKYTTARRLAETVVDAALRSTSPRPPASRSAATPVFGAVEQFSDLLGSAMAQRPGVLSEAAVGGLVQRYGSGYRDVLRYLEPTRDPRSDATADADLWRAETIHAVRHEMAQTLCDVVFRRTGIGAAGEVPSTALTLCADAMRIELGWRADRVEREIAGARQALVAARWSN